MLNRVSFFILATILLFLSASSQGNAQQPYNWHIQNATIVNGTGADAYEADILIKNDRISHIGQLDADTVEVQHTVDASGRVVSPGFIDTHVHGDPLETPEFENFLAMGVTTILHGQDGSSSAVGELDEWLREVESKQPGPNFATLSGHGSIRGKVDVGRQEASAFQLEEMTMLLESDLEDGAFGMSTGLEYVPGMYADEGELRHLAEIVGRHGGLVMSHMRSEDDSEIENSLDELATLGDLAPVHASHLKVVYGEGSDRAKEILDHIEKYRRDGISFTADTYPYAASFTGIGIVFPEWAKTENEWKNALDERPQELERFLEDKVKQRNGPDAVLFGTGDYAGQTLAEAADQQGVTPVEFLMDMGPEGGSAAHFVMNEELQDRIAIDEDVMISSDGSPTMRHPRGYGSFAKIIDRYVNEQQSLSIEEAVHKMSGMPAQVLHLSDRGVIREGNKADLLIFKPQEVKDRATFENPHELAEGFDWVMVNGSLVRKDGSFTEERNGEVLRNKPK